MNLQNTIKEILGYHISKENALKFADEQFGVLASYIRKNPPKVITPYDDVIKRTTMLEIDEQAIIHNIILELEDKEILSNKTHSLYKGSVFKEILDEYENGEVEFNLKTIKQLRELNKLFGEYDYIKINN